MLEFMFLYFSCEDDGRDFDMHESCGLNPIVRCSYEMKNGIRSSSYPPMLREKVAIIEASLLGGGWQPMIELSRRKTAQPLLVCRAENKRTAHVSEEVFCRLWEAHHQM